MWTQPEPFSWLCGGKDVPFCLLVKTGKVQKFIFAYTCERPWEGSGLRWSFREEESWMPIPGLCMFWNIFPSPWRVMGPWDRAVGEMLCFGWQLWTLASQAKLHNWSSMVMLRYQKLISLLIAINASLYVFSFPSLAIKVLTHKFKFFHPGKCLYVGQLPSPNAWTPLSPFTYVLFGSPLPQST